MITITMLGTSALLPLPERALTSVFLKCDRTSLLLDCGEGTQSAARKAGISLMGVNIIALTHYHGDHIFGLPGLLQTMFSMTRTEPLTIVGPAGIEEALAPIMKLTGYTGYDITLAEMPKEGIAFENGARLTAFPTEHRVLSQGYAFELPRAGKFDPVKARELGIPVPYWGRLQKGESVGGFEPAQVLGAPRRGLKFVFSGDTTACEGLKNAAQNADLLICEGTYGENEQEQLAIDHGHMNFAMAARLAKEANVTELWLTHFSQMIEDTAEYLPNAAAIFPNTVAGVDGMSETLRFID